MKMYLIFLFSIDLSFNIFTMFGFIYNNGPRIKKYKNLECCMNFIRVFVDIFHKTIVKQKKK